MRNIRFIFHTFATQKNVTYISMKMHCILVYCA